MFPKLGPAKLLEKFFYIYGYEWQWDKWNILIETEDNISRKVINDNNNRQNGFTIMTPAYPQANSTFNINQYTKGIILDFFKSGYKIVSNILNTNELVTDNNQLYYKQKWSELFREFPFFEKYNHYLEVNVVGQENNFFSWKSFIEAKIRFIAKHIDENAKNYKLKVHYWPHFYNSTCKFDFPLACRMFIGLKVLQKREDKIDLTFPVWNFIIEMDELWEKNNGKREPDYLNLIV